MKIETKRTVLYNRHKEQGATFSDFGGYTMPLWYNSAVKEHISVLKNAGLFDTSHMSIITIHGSDSHKLINRTFSRDITKYKNNRAVYGLFLNTDNTVIDDAIVYKIDDETVLIVVNAGMSSPVIKFIESQNVYGAIVSDKTELLGKVDIQGPYSLRIMETLYGKEMCNNFPFFSFKGTFDDVLISRSGYTGEFGFEIIADMEKIPKIWDSLLEIGREYQITPCGLAARDSLRVGANLPLSHQDIGAWEFGNTPWDFALDREPGLKGVYTYPFVGYDLRKLHSNSGDVIYNNKSIGRVLSCVTEVSLTRVDNKILSVTSPDLPEDTKVKGLVSGFLQVNRKLDYGENVILSDFKRELKVEIVKDIRPNRTAKKSIEYIRRNYE